MRWKIYAMIIMLGLFQFYIVFQFKYFNSFQSFCCLRILISQSILKQMSEQFTNLLNILLIHVNKIDSYLCDRYLMQKMKPNPDDGDSLTIINRSVIYCVSKRMFCSSIQYFEKMFCCDLLESRENKVTLDLDENSFELIVNWVYSGCVEINMTNVIPLYTCADYLMIDTLTTECNVFFFGKFTLIDLPIILDAATEVTKLVNRNMINSFISRHFLKIVKSKPFLTFPYDTVRQMLKLNLWIDSEFQICEAIVKWIDFNPDGRKHHFIDLIKLIRWCYVDFDVAYQIKGYRRFNELTQFTSIMCKMANCSNGCSSNRSMQSSLISIFEISKDTVEILINCKSSSWIPCGLFSLDETISDYIICEEHFSDVVFDAGRKGVRIDWSHRKFRWLNMIGSSFAYYGQIYSVIMSHVEIPEAKVFYLDNINQDYSSTDEVFGDSFFEYGGSFVTVGFSKFKKLFCIFPIDRKSWYFGDFTERAAITGTIIKRTIYIISEDLAFRIIDPVSRSCFKTEPFKEYQFSFENLQLTNHESNLLLIDKASKDLLSYDIGNKKWAYSGKMINPNLLVAISSVNLPTKHIKKLYFKKDLTLKDYQYYRSDSVAGTSRKSNKWNQCRAQ